MEYRKDIQGLRAVAVLVVWIFHLNNNILSGGFIGVDIFFVISGFLITSIILYQKEHDKFSFKNFYWSRIKRIVPAYYVFLFIISIATLFVYLPFDVLNGVRRHLFNAVIFNSNNHLAVIDTYFGASSSENPFLHTWTLAIEMQFYLLLPFLVYFISRKKCLFISIILCLGLYGYTQYEILHGNQSLMYFSLLARSPEFLLGVILSLVCFKNKLHVIGQSILSFLGLLLILFSSFYFNEKTLFPGLATLLPCLGAILILVNKDSIVNQKLLSNKVMVYIGELSYSIYLWHWGILALMRYYYAEYNLTLSQYFVAILLTCILSYLSYHIIEQKIKKMNIKKTILTLSSFCLFVLLFMAFMKPMYKVFFKDTSLFKYASPDVILGFETYAKYPNDVIYGDAQATDTLLLIGNSHALTMTPFLDALGKKEHFALRSISNGFYPMIPNVKRKFLVDQSEDLFYYASYKNVIDTALNKIRESSIIILSVTMNFDPTAMENALCSLDSMLRKDQSVILLSDYPVLDKNPIRMTRGFLKPEKELHYELMYKKPTQNILDFIDKNPNFHYLDLSDSEAFKQAPFYNDTVMYYDAWHLNEYGSLVYEKYSGKKLAHFIKELQAQ